MIDPLFWLGLSLLFVTMSLTIALIVMIPTLREVARAARSAEKLFETLRREFPPTLEAIRLTGMEISDLTDDITEGVQSAGQVAKQVDQTITGARQQARKVQLSARSMMTGVKTAWKTFTRPQSAPRRKEQLPPARPEPETLGDGNGTRFISKAGELVEESTIAPNVSDQWLEESDARGRD